MNARLVFTGKAKVCSLFILLAVVSIVLCRVAMLPTSEAGLTWRGIRVGESTTGDVLQLLGSPDCIKRPIGSVIYCYNPDVRGRLNDCTPLIVFKGGRVAQITDAVHVYPGDTFLSEFIDLYGTPDYVTWTIALPYEREVVFLDDGVKLSVSISASGELKDTRVVYATYFLPCSLICVLLQDLSLPIAELSQPPDGLPKDPWDFTTSQ